MISSARTRHVALGLAVAAIAAICAPGAARASEVMTFGSAEIKYKAYTGEDNDLKITDTGSAVVFEEASVSISPAPPVHWWPRRRWPAPSPASTRSR
jgi:hypothetical protein